LRLKQQEELASVKKAQEGKTLSHEKRQEELDDMLSFLIRTMQQSSQAANKQHRQPEALFIIKIC
jgi:hypothetical protein